MSNVIHIIKLVEHRKPPAGKDDRSMIDSEGGGMKQTIL